MKNLMLAVIGLSLSCSAFAKESVTFYCYEYQAKEEYQLRMYLTYTGDLINNDIREGKEYEFKVKMFNGRFKKPTLQTSFLVSREDVMMKFKTLKGSRTKIAGMFYLDEPEDAWIKINGKTKELSCINKKFLEQN